MQVQLSLSGAWFIVRAFPRPHKIDAGARLRVPARKCLIHQEDSFEGTGSFETCGGRSPTASASLTGRESHEA